MPALDGWPSPRAPRGSLGTEPGVQPDSSAIPPPSLSPPSTSGCDVLVRRQLEDPYSPVAAGIDGLTERVHPRFGHDPFGSTVAHLSNADDPVQSPLRSRTGPQPRRPRWPGPVPSGYVSRSRRAVPSMTVRAFWAGPGRSPPPSPVAFGTFVAADTSDSFSGRCATNQQIVRQLACLDHDDPGGSHDDDGSSLNAARSGQAVSLSPVMGDAFSLAVSDRN